MPSVLVTGANRGLGLEFARQYAAAGWDVLATCRAPREAADLAALGGRVSIFALDAGDDRSIESFLGEAAPCALDLIIANAGIGCGAPLAADAVTRAVWDEIIGVNVYAPLRLVAGLRGNLERGTHKKVVGISGLAASFAQYRIGGQFAYRASKAALNSLWRTLSVEWRPLGITCLLLRPGKVRTRMTGFTGDLSPEASVTGMRRVIDGAGIAESGKFYGYDGAEVPW
jgi:NAD(P)-dependent dehydrogenase (short-subunit alcohol dehydrogenase family)